MNIILNGASGSGKGSLAKFINRDFGLVHISTGEIFRENISNQTPLGKKAAEYVNAGKWVPDDVTVDVLVDRIMQRDCENGVILDGFPRTLNQAKLLDKYLDVDLVLTIDVPDDVVIKRLSGRYMCKKCGAIHSIRWDDITKCKNCGGELYQRDDDKLEVIKQRLENFKLNNKDILDYYKSQGKLVVIHDKLEYSPDDTYKIAKKYLNKK
jgi:adenylate kinase